MKDLDLEAYTEAIEAHLRARRGKDHVLSPRDFALAKSWHKAGVPLATVLVGVDRAFEAEPTASSLAFCRRRVEELMSSGSPPQERTATANERVPVQELSEVLAVLFERLVALRPGPDACFEPPVSKVREMQDLLAVASRPNWEYLRTKLREIDEDVSAAVLRALSDEERASFRAEAARSVERHRARVDDASLEDAVARYTLHRARERMGLPRVGMV
jgi:hypothetical protein